MLIYCAHAYGGNSLNVGRASEIIRQLQIHDPDNCYVSPIHAFSFLNYGDLSYDDEMELCYDLMSMCDRMLVLSEISEGVRREIELANRWGMEVSYHETADRKNADTD